MELVIPTKVGLKCMSGIISVIMTAICQKPATLGEVMLISQLYRPLSKFIQKYVIIGLMADNTHILMNYNTFLYPHRFPDGGDASVNQLAVRTHLDTVYSVTSFTEIYVSIAMGNSAV